jgi:hypothetical protein
MSKKKPERELKAEMRIDMEQHPLNRNPAIMARALERIVELEKLEKQLIADRTEWYRRGIDGFQEAVLVEREACAKVCDGLGDQPGWRYATRACAEVIRSRGSKEAE